MALHRDIYWVGRQWAVTGFGVQAIDQRLKGAFDIEASRLWEDDLTERMRAHAWLNAADFDKALTVARARFPEPPRKTLALVDRVLELIQPASPEPSKPVAPPPETSALPGEPAPIEPCEPRAVATILAPRSEAIALPSEPAWIEPLEPPAVSVMPEPRSETGASLVEPVPIEPCELPAVAVMPVLRAEGRLARFLPQWRVRR